MTTKPASAPDPGPDSRAVKPDYGVDAPGVVRNLYLACAAGHEASIKALRKALARERRCTPELDAIAARLDDAGR